MRIVVMTPTGHVGSQVAESLLEQGAELTVMARDPGKVKNLEANGARVVRGSLDDEAAVKRATDGADDLFWVTPGSMDAADFRAAQDHMGRVAAAAVKANRIWRIVNLSSVGAQKASGHGPVNGLHDIEDLFDQASPNVTHLRPTFFFENYLMHIDSIREKDAIFMPIRGNVRVPMIATHDVAAAAVERLLDDDWTGQSVMGLHGPRDYSFDELADIVSKVLGKLVRHITVPPEAARQSMLEMGAGASAVDAYLEMYAAMDSGAFEIAEPRTTETTTSTTFERFAEKVLRPLVEHPSMSAAQHR